MIHFSLDTQRFLVIFNHLLFSRYLDSKKKSTALGIMIAEKKQYTNYKLYITTVPRRIPTPNITNIN